MIWAVFNYPHARALVLGQMATLVFLALAAAMWALGRERDGLAATARFFAADTPDEERLALLREWQVIWLFYGPEERALGGFDPAAVPYLELAFRQGEVTVYRVTTEGVP